MMWDSQLSTSLQFQNEQLFHCIATKAHQKARLFCYYSFYLYNTIKYQSNQPKGKLKYAKVLSFECIWLQILSRQLRCSYERETDVFFTLALYRGSLNWAV